MKVRRYSFSIVIFDFFSILTLFFLGRRVRAVVTCPRTDDCCSPNPKRRGQKITLNRDLLTPSKKTITDFFQVCIISTCQRHSNC